MSLRQPHPTTVAEYQQAAYCPSCNYWIKMQARSPRGDHGCTSCGGQMEVYVLRDTMIGHRVLVPATPKEEPHE
jgi:hypothetical protein